MHQEKNKEERELPELYNVHGASSLSQSRRVWVESVTVLLRHKVLIATVTLITTLVALYYAFFIAVPWFSAYSVVLPARRAGGSILDNVSAGLASGLKDLGVGKFGSNPDASYTPLSLAQSRELADTIIFRFDLMKEYETNTLADAEREFFSHEVADLTDDGSFRITFEDRDPKRAPVIVNAIIDQMNQINARLAIVEAKNNRFYLEQRYQKNLDDLDSAEKSLGAFQRRFGVYSLPEQARSELATVATLEQQKYATEIQLHTAEQVYGLHSSEAEVYRSTIEQLGQKLAQLNVGLDTKASSFVPTTQFPDVALQYLRLMREVEIQSKLKGFLLPTYEQARLDEKKQMLGFIVLDHAVAPQAKSRPKRSLLVVFAFFGSLVTTAIVVLFAANLQSSLRKFHNDRRALGI